MNTKLNFSKRGVKDFFFRHMEKMFFGLACALILLFVWLGFKTPAFDATTPAAMLTKTNEAETYINDNSHWNKLAEHRVADEDAATRIKEAKPVDPNTYSFRQIFGTAVFTREPRRDPALVPVKNFETRYVHAQVAQTLKNESGESQLALSGVSSLPDSVLTYPQDQQNESFIYRTKDLPKSGIKLRTVNAVVGMALIDHAQQLTNYKENFQYQRGYDTTRDVPEYAFIEVQRKSDDSDWESITSHIYEISTYLAPPAKELADDKYLIPTVALPIPPFLGIDYRQFSLVDEIPTRNVFAEDERGGQSRDDSRDESSDTEDDPFGKGRDESDSDKEEKDPQTSASEDMEEEEIIPVRLVRFYDLEYKEVGKTYSYRLRVWLKDPNNPDAVNADIASQLDDQNKKKGGVGIGGGLAGGGSQVDGGGRGGGGSDDKNKGNMAKKKKKPLSEFDLSREVRNRIKSDDTEIPADLDDERKELYRLARPSEWVESAQPVTITSGFEYFVAGPVSAPPVIRFGGGAFTATEPSINIVANSFQDDLGVFVPAETEAMRGSLLNYDAVTHLLDPLTSVIKDVFDSEDSRGQKQGRHFKTEAVVLDIMGGQRQPFSSIREGVFYAPGECLIMDRNFQIHVHNDMDDETAYRHANFISDDNTDALEESRGRKKDDDEDSDMGGDGGRGR